LEESFDFASYFDEEYDMTNPGEKVKGQESK